MEQEKIYYYYRYDLGQTDISIEELDIYENEELDKVRLSVNNDGQYRFRMIADKNDKQDLFFQQISTILAAEMQFANHVLRASEGRFWQFDHFWREYDERKTLEPKYTYYHYVAELVFSQKDSSTQLMNQLYAATDDMQIEQIDIHLGNPDEHLGDDRRMLLINFATKDQAINIEKIREILFKSCKSLKGISVGDYIKEGKK